MAAPEKVRIRNITGSRLELRAYKRALPPFGFITVDAPVAPDILWLKGERQVSIEPEGTAVPIIGPTAQLHKRKLKALTALNVRQAMTSNAAATKAATPAAQAPAATEAPTPATTQKSK
jgi:hypothetical protein